MGLRAWLECTAIAAAYVLPLHRGKETPRNDPLTIFRRAATTLLACCLTWLPLWHALRTHSQSAEEAWRQLPAALGLHAHGLIAAIALPLVLTAALFLGPLAMVAADRFEARLQRRQCSQPQTQQQQHEDSSTSDQYSGGSRKGHQPAATWPQALRNLVVAPLTEEWAFRACMLPLLLLGGSSVKAAVLAVPLFFGVAHLHHLYELVVFQRYGPSRACQQVLAQLVYTTIFGWYAAWLFVRSGHLAAAVAAHVFCNFVGFPDFDRLSNHRFQPLLQAATAAGVVLFSILLRPLTEPSVFGHSSSVVVEGTGLPVALGSAG